LIGQRNILEALPEGLALRATLSHWQNRIYQGETHFIGFLAENPASIGESS
jgi:hypothetical protein